MIVATQRFALDNDRGPAASANALEPIDRKMSGLRQTGWDLGARLCRVPLRRPDTPTIRTRDGGYRDAMPGLGRVRRHH